jgi:hypothetical protein
MLLGGFLSQTPAEYAKRYLSYQVKVGSPPRMVTVALKSLRYRNALCSAPHFG